MCGNVFGNHGDRDSEKEVKNVERQETPKKGKVNKGKKKELSRA